MHSGFSSHLSFDFHFVLYTALYLPRFRKEGAARLQPGEHSEAWVRVRPVGAEGQAVWAGALGGRGAWLTASGAGSAVWWLFSPSSAPS